MSHAVAYARPGLEVLPLMPGGKVPLGKLAPHGKDDATCDVEQVRDWWVQAPDANVGLRPAAGIVVLDVDPRNGGATALAELTGEYGALTPTWTAWTGGGLHAWYRAAGPLRSKFCEGVDLKSHTGYVVVPPSLHSSGKRYSWANDLPIAEAPRWLAGLVRAAPPPLHRPGIASTFTTGGPAADAALVARVAGAQPGNRNELLHWAACRAAERGGLDQLAGRLRDAALTAGLDDAEVCRTLASAADRAVMV